MSGLTFNIIVACFCLTTACFCVIMVRQYQMMQAVNMQLAALIELYDELDKLSQDQPPQNPMK